MTHLCDSKQVAARTGIGETVRLLIIKEVFDFDLVVEHLVLVFLSHNCGPMRTRIYWEHVSRPNTAAGETEPRRSLRLECVFDS